MILGVSLVAYFAAVLARTEDGWDVSETELDDVETLADLTDLARDSTQDDDSVLIFIEQEDAWFAIVRVDGEEDPRIFVSDGAAAARSSYGSVLTDELVDQAGESEFGDLDHLVVELEDSEEEESEEPDEDARGGVPVGPLGDAHLLTEFGLAADELLALSGEGAVPGDALEEIAEALGCGEVLEAVR
ncbi:putative tRNA adenosine deaminase-associated protein [Kitasatospora sp. MAA19]|uniref:tRNA adenosine deaminase-associated protein n=1 Tax=unclassified Kitasatospora TaxID=2633591 RepID=UPI002474997F|nr:tRNA adenosine deaminase-associated protein [Kitasatospora sp. MAA19]MDH6703480.1 putative tRNA adenosine deaminase-associated protein [Kitasatospora sp. MAA19]